LSKLLRFSFSNSICLKRSSNCCFFGSNRFPEAAKKIGKIVGEYKKAKDTVEKQMKDVTKENFEVSGPVKDERQKLDAMSKILGIDSKSKSDEELKGIIKNKIGQPENETQTKK